MAHGCSSDPAVWAVDRPAPAASGVRGLDRSRPRVRPRTAWGRGWTRARSRGGGDGDGPAADWRWRVHVIRRGFTLPGHWRLLAGEDGRRRQEKADAKRKICPSPRLSPSHTHPSGNATESLIGDRHSGRGREGGRRRRRPRLASSGEPATALLDRCRSQASVGVAREDKASSQLPSSSSGRCPVVRPAASPAPQGCGPPPKEQ